VGIEMKGTFMVSATARAKWVFPEPLGPVMHTLVLIDIGNMLLLVLKQIVAIAVSLENAAS